MTILNMTVFVTLRELDLSFLSNLKEFDRGDNFPLGLKKKTEFRLVHKEKNNSHYDILFFHLN